MFRLRCMQSRYFVPGAKESLTRVVHDFGDPFSLPSIYTHMRRHQISDLQKARERFREIEHPHTGLAIKAAGAVEGDVVSKSNHEIALDELIVEGREKLLRKELPITATTFLTAIKIRSDIDKNTKDRRMEMVKSFFTGSPKGERSTLARP